MTERVNQGTDAAYPLPEESFKSLAQGAITPTPGGDEPRRSRKSIHEHFAEIELNVKEEKKAKASKDEKPKKRAKSPRPKKGDKKADTKLENIEEEDPSTIGEKDKDKKKPSKSKSKAKVKNK